MPEFGVELVKVLGTLVAVMALARWGFRLLSGLVSGGVSDDDGD